jgi:hypothetical protein
MLNLEFVLQDRVPETTLLKDLAGALVVYWTGPLQNKEGVVDWFERRGIPLARQWSFSSSS